MDAQLHETAKTLVAEGKGILAADESSGTIKKRFDSIDVESTEENWRAYRDLLFTAGRRAAHQRRDPLRRDDPPEASDGTPFPKLLESKGIMPGIKVDRGKPLALARGRRSPRAWTGSASGSRNTSPWARASRSGAPINIGEGLPSEYALDERPRACALRGALPGGRPCADRRARGVDGRGRTRSRRARDRPRPPGRVHGAARPAGRVQGTLLKPNMVLTGYEASDRAGADEVADATLEVLSKHLPAAVPGIVFLSGGQTDEDATAHLNAMNARGPHPWELSFSYGRALQAPALRPGAATRQRRRPRRRRTTGPPERRRHDSGATRPTGSRRKVRRP